MIKRFLALALCFVVVFCNIVSFAVNAEEERPTVYTLSIISNEMNDDCINGYMYGDETFISIDDVCTLTRSTFDIDKSKVNLYHGVMEVQIDTSENKITFWNQSTNFETKRYKDKILVKPYAILELLCARCSYIDDDKVLCVLMPSITIYEALDFDLYNKCYYNIYKGDEFNTIVRATSALFSDVAFDGVGNFFNMLVESFSFNGSDRYIDRALIEISDVKINEFASVENQMSQTLENRNKAVECVEKASGYSEGVGSLASAYVDILEETIGNSDSSINIATKALSKTANIVDYLSLIKSAEEKLDYDLDSFELIGKVMTEENIGSIEGTDYIIERADYISETLESRLAQYFETTEQKVREKAFEKIMKDSAKILDKGSKYPIGEISAFILSCEIGTTVTKLLMNDKFEAWDADMNAIMLSEIQNTMYDVIRNKYTNCFANYDNAIEFVDALNLYNRTSIAMYSNLKKADEEFDIYVESFTGKFSGECDRMCEKLALNTYNLHSCNPEEDICSLEDFQKYYNNDITDAVDISESDSKPFAIDLINKTIPEIIDIMGGTYEVIEGPTDGDVYIYNYSKLPGIRLRVFVDWLRAWNGDSLNVKQVRKDLESGLYDDFWIEVHDNAFATPDISADMNYEECCSILGELECNIGTIGTGAPDSFCYTYTLNGCQVELHFDIISDLFNELKGPYTFSYGDMIRYNPDLICVLVKRTQELSTDTITNENVINASSYTWHIKPSIEADNIIVSDDSSYEITPSSRKYERAYDKYSVIQIGNSYSLIDYNGKRPIDKDYRAYSFSDVGDIILYNKESSNQCCIVSDGWRKSGQIEIYHDVELARGDSGGYECFYYDENKMTVYGDSSLWTKEYDGKIEIFGEMCNKAVLVQSADVENDSQYLSVKNRGKYGISYNNSIIVDTIYDDGKMTLFNDYIALQKGDKWGYFDGKTGKQIIDFICNSVSLNKIYFRDNDGEIIRESTYPYIFSDGYLAVYTDSGCGYYDTKGKEIIPCGTFEEVRPVHNGLAWVKKDGKWGVIQLKDYENNDSSILNNATSEAQLSDYEILNIINQYLEDNSNQLGIWLSDSNPYCPAKYMYSNDERWSCPINLDFDVYSSNEIAGSHPHFAFVDKRSLVCTLMANYETVVEFNISDYME